MISEAHCESMFEQVNTVDGSHMEPFTSDSFEADKKIEAMRNANTIKKNIQKLVRIFRRPDKEALLRKEFKDAIKANPEQSSFAEQYRRMMVLYKVKFCTSLEEANRMQEQLFVSNRRVLELEDQKAKKQTDLDAFQNNSKDSKETRHKLIEDLKNTHAKHK